MFGIENKSMSNYDLATINSKLEKLRKSSALFLERSIEIVVENTL